MGLVSIPPKDYPVSIANSAPRSWPRQTAHHIHPDHACGTGTHGSSEQGGHCGKGDNVCRGNFHLSFYPYYPIYTPPLYRGYQGLL